MSERRIALGREAEAYAARELERRGLEMLARNVRVRYAELGIAGEIDLIALDTGTLVIIEVKAAREGSLAGPERAALAVGRRKQLRLRRLARAWLASGPPLPRWHALRFDVVGVTVGRDGRVIACEWIRDAF